MVTTNTENGILLHVIIFPHDIVIHYFHCEYGTVTTLITWHTVIVQIITHCHAQQQQQQQQVTCKVVIIITLIYILFDIMEYYNMP